MQMQGSGWKKRGGREGGKEETPALVEGSKIKVAYLVHFVEEMDEKRNCIMITIKTIHDYEYLPFNNNCYVFRGQSKECLCLLPGAYRQNDVKNRGPKIEIEWVQQFIHHLLESGYHTFPGDLDEYKIFTTSSCVFPTYDLLPYLAVAQHYASDSVFHCLKTSLLDITYNLDIAAYFAVNQDCKDAGKIFVFDKSSIKPPYKIFEPHLDKRQEARMIVQDGAFIYREQEYENEEMHRYKKYEPFDDTVFETVIVPSVLKEELREHLQKKLFDSILLPKLILGPRTVPTPSTGERNDEEIMKLYKPQIDAAKNEGNRHKNY